MRRVKVRSQKTETVSSDGEITNTDITTHFTTIVGEEDKYFKVHFSLLSKIFALKSALDIKLFLKLCELSEYNTGIVRVSGEQRQRLCHLFCTTESGLSRSLSGLRSAGLIYGHHGHYTINFAVVWKGDVKTRDALIEGRGDALFANMKS